MGGIVNQILESQEKSDERYFELEEKRMKLEPEDKEREERMKKDEMEFQLRMMSMIAQTHTHQTHCILVLHLTVHHTINIMIIEVLGS